MPITAIKSDKYSLVFCSSPPQSVYGGLLRFCLTKYGTGIPAWAYIVNTNRERRHLKMCLSNLFGGNGCGCSWLLFVIILLLICNDDNDCCDNNSNRNCGCGC